MPTKNSTKTPQHIIEKAVNRYLQGESAGTLAKEYKISRPGFYLWVNKYKEQLVEAAKRANVSAPNIDKAQKVDLVVENSALRGEVDRLKQKLFELMLKTNNL